MRNSKIFSVKMNHMVCVLFSLSDCVNMKQKTQLKYVSELINCLNPDASKILFSSIAKWKQSFRVIISDVSG